MDPADVICVVIGLAFAVAMYADPQYRCWVRGHGRVEARGLSGECERCGYIGMIDPVSGRLFWS